MACANRGFYVHLSTLAEVRERVLEHVNVLARPLVLQREKHPVVWTPVYANVTVNVLHVFCIYTTHGEYFLHNIIEIVD